jgi:hypothetical protein
MTTFWWLAAGGRQPAVGGRWLAAGRLAVRGSPLAARGWRLDRCPVGNVEVPRIAHKVAEFADPVTDAGKSHG